MSNKTEKDIKLLENFADICKKGFYKYDPVEEGYALERILKRIKKLEERYEEQNNELLEWVKQCKNNQTEIDRLYVEKEELEQAYLHEKIAKEEVEELLESSIPKQKVKDAIEKHKIAKEGFEKEYDSKHYKDDDLRVRDFYGIITQDRIIQVLEKLLEDK